LAQIFPRGSNSVAKLSLLVVLLLAGGAFTLLFLIYQSSAMTGQGIPIEQPVPFSHKHHVGGLGIDCRYCHTSVEQSGFAGIPSAKTCMTCHSQIWTNAKMLQPVRDAFQSGQPIPWVRVHELPDHVYFDHSIHVAKGIACTTCHGPVDEMPLMKKQNTLWMSWCIGCHRHPEISVGLKEAVFRPDAAKPSTRSDADTYLIMLRRAVGKPVFSTHEEEAGRTLVEKYKIEPPLKLTDCSVCHR
jgi:Cytochrome c7 and related cytochrome c/Class III cytochrome C family